MNLIKLRAWDITSSDREDRDYFINLDFLGSFRCTYIKAENKTKNFIPPIYINLSYGATYLISDYESIIKFSEAIKIPVDEITGQNKQS